MATIRAYTTIEQSKVLAEILPFKSADMYYEWPNKKKVHFKDDKYSGMGFSCWSLASLLDILSKTTHSIDEDGSVDLCDYKNIEWSLCLTNTNVGLFIANNPVDACYRMILKLHELKML